MKDKEKAKNYNALYHKQHWVAIALKNQMYKNLPHIKERRKQENQKRKDYFKKYYQEHKEYFRAKHTEWLKQNPEKRELILKRYADKLKLRTLRRRAKLERSPKIQNMVIEFIEYCKQRYAKDTVRQYKMNMQRFLKYIDKPGTRCSAYHSKLYQEYKKLPEQRDYIWKKDYCKVHLAKNIDRDLITAYVSYVNCDEINAKGIKLNQSEKESRLYPLKAFLLYCQRKGYIEKDLRKFIIIPSREKKIIKRLMTVEEMEKFLLTPDEKSTIGIRDKALLELSYAGFRANELLTLKIKDVDLITNAVTILNAKGDKDRVVPMTNEAIYWIRRWLNRRHEFIENCQDPEYLFLTRGTKRIIRRHFSRLIKRYAIKAKIPIDISPHDLRRTTATHLAENGAPVRLIQALLGHTTLKVTTKYLRLSDEKIKKEHKQTHPSNRRNLYYGNLQR